MGEEQERPKENIALGSVVSQAPKSEREVREKRQEPSQHETAMMIADRLGETEETQRKYFQHIVWALGRSQSRRLLRETLEIGTQGPMMLPDDSRSRTPGEIFFHLAQTHGKPKRGKVLSPFSSFVSDNAEVQQGLPSHKEDAQKIAARLGENAEPQL